VMEYKGEVKKGMECTLMGGKEVWWEVYETRGKSRT